MESTHFTRAFLTLTIIIGSGRWATGADKPADSALPAEWLSTWNSPSVNLRPLQIVHNVPADRSTPGAMTELKEWGLGGITCNVDFADYLVSEKNWATLVTAVESCRQVGLRVWLYDEKGYPSGAAGGLVLKENPRFEALALAIDSASAEGFLIRPAFEHTHASNNYCAARRYINLIDAAAVRMFIAKTHDAYWQRLEPHFGKTIEAIFTDEPSLMAVNIGQLPEKVRSKISVEDPLDESVKPLPSVAWSSDLAEQYRRRYGQDLLTVRRSLFAGDSDADRLVRRRFWALIADLTAERYFGQIQEWCRDHRIASSGHTLWEETPVVHVPLEGNALKALRRMDIPGLDMLSSDPEAVIHAGWMAAMLPQSAALIEGRRRVMTEVSDFSQTQGGRPPVPLAAMQATAAWHAALGVTEFTLYYNRQARSQADFRAYCDYVGRLNALLRDARFEPCVLLYYPIHDLWEEYLPVAEPLRTETQSKRAQRLVNSFLRLGQHLLTSQVPFVIADHEVLASAQVRDGRLWVRDYGFDGVVLPDGVALPDGAGQRVEQFKKQSGHILTDDLQAAPPVLHPLMTAEIPARLDPPSNRIVLGSFSRDDRDILLLANVGKEAYTGSIVVSRPGEWVQADPATGRLDQASADSSRKIPISLPSHASVLLVSPPKR